MERLCTKHNLLRNDDGVVRVPFLVKGRIVVPPEIGRGQIEAAFSEVDENTTCVKLPEYEIHRRIRLPGHAGGKWR